MCRSLNFFSTSSKSLLFSFYIYIITILSHSLLVYFCGIHVRNQVKDNIHQKRLIHCRYSLHIISSNSYFSPACYPSFLLHQVSSNFVVLRRSDSERLRKELKAKKMQSDSWLVARANGLDLFIGDYPPYRCLCLSNWITQKFFTFPPRKQSFLLTLVGSSPSSEHWELGGWFQPQMGSTFCQSHSLQWLSHHFSPLYVVLPAASACSSFSACSIVFMSVQPSSWTGWQHSSEVFRNREGHSHCSQLLHDLHFIWTDPNLVLR